MLSSVLSRGLGSLVILQAAMAQAHLLRRRRRLYQIQLHLPLLEAGPRSVICDARYGINNFKRIKLVSQSSSCSRLALATPP